jgi:hypothetical protein
MNGGPFRSGPGDRLHLFRNWAIALLDVAQGFAGEVVEESPGVVTFEPAYAFLGPYQVGPQGVGRIRVLVPVEMQVGIMRLEIRYSALIRFANLAAADYTELAGQFEKLVEAAESLRSNTRTQRSGLVLAPAGAKLPPMPVRG